MEGGSLSPLPENLTIDQKKAMCVVAISPYSLAMPERYMEQLESYTG